ncbi:MAG: Xaa-Pro peptidase family protein [Chloroflexota bacterium]|nr:Xaa-Pro peptidase family protein [Chloroflexota bacterium]
MSGIDTDVHAARLARLRTAMVVAGFAAVYTTHPANRRYLTGYTGEDHPPNESAGALLITADAAYLRTSVVNAAQARAETPDYEVVAYARQDEATQQLQEIVARHTIRRIGFDESAMLYTTYQWLGATLPDVELAEVGSLISDLRLIKDAAEIALLRRAQAITVAAFVDVSARIIAGMTERDVAWELEKAVRTHGGEGLGFSTIVGAGENGARPHHTVTDRPIRAGEPVVIDMGAQYEGYSGDLTRTIVVGEPDDQFRRVYDVVLRAMRHAEEVARPGMTGGDLDAAARGVIAEAGYGDAFLHGLGHGIGLQVHEAPSARKEGTDVFAAGMSLTIEPGVYLPDWGGVRIEDLVVFTSTGIINLTDAPVLAV